MNKEQLLSAGFSETQVTTILDMYKKSIDGQYIPKHRFDEVNTELKNSKEQLVERDKQIQSLKKFEGDSKALSDKIKELEESNKQKDAQYRTELTLEKKKNAIKLALLEDPESKPYDTDMVMGLIDLEKVVFDEATGKLTSGFKEQSDSIKKEKAFLFEQKTEPQKPTGILVKGVTPKDGDGNKGVETAETYGKSLAAIKLGMMGITTDEAQK